MCAQAIVSDVHGNIEALEVVLNDICDRGIKQIICLGDLIGYGPNPKECLDAAIDFDLTILGNHEEAVLHAVEMRGFNPGASQAVQWTVDQFDMLGPDKARNARRWDFLGELPRTFEQENVLCVHGAPPDKTREYVRIADCRNPRKMARLFSYFNRVCFVGHSHVPGVWSEDLSYYTPKSIENRFRFDARKVIVNVGAVGQPRDHDNRACYVVLHGPYVEWVRVPYDVKKTCEKIRAIPELSDSLAERLETGA